MIIKHWDFWLWDKIFKDNVPKLTQIKKHQNTLFSSRDVVADRQVNT